MYGSRWLVNELYRLAFCIPYQEVVRFKQFVLQNSDNTIVPLHGSPFTQWSADNVDHNTATLDGKNTFHGMGMIAMSIAPNSDNIPQTQSIKRIEKRITVSELTKNKGVDIIS